MVNLRRSKVLIFVVLIQVLLSGIIFLWTSSIVEASGTVYYVAINGDDRNSGTIDSPFRTIQVAVNRVQAGDKVYVRTGTYAEQIVIANSGTADNPITVAAYPGESPVIDGENQLPAGSYPDAKWAPLVLIGGSYIVFDGFEVRNSRGRGVQIYPGHHNILRHLNIHHVWNSGIHDQSEYTLVENSMVWQAAQSNAGENQGKDFWPVAFVAVDTENHTYRRNHVYNNHGEGMAVLRSGNVMLEDNVIYDNWAVNLYIDNGHDVLAQRNLVYCTDDREFWPDVKPAPGISLNDEPYKDRPATGQNHRIINNIVIGCGVNFSVWAQHPDSGMKNMVVANNTFVEAQGNTDADILGIRIQANKDKSTPSQFTNNIVLQSRGTIASVADEPALHFSHNLWSQPVSGRASSPDDVIDYPMLVNPAATLVAGAVSPEWYKLQAASPARDEAKMTLEITEDFFAASRDNTPDIGAHEYSDTEPVTPPPPGSDTSSTFLPVVIR